MRIGILTGGGDVPGLNACIKAVVTRVTDEGHQVVGIRRGWGGLVSTNPDDPDSIKENLIPLTRANTRTIDRSGGTVLHTVPHQPAEGAGQGACPSSSPTASGARSARPHPPRAACARGPGHRRAHPDRRRRHALIRLRLHDEGFPVIAIPKTMDNDVYGTDYASASPPP
jgi:ATP-dependent phosphofructokinase / diphosphate-dependent phosphofructokinase